MSPRDFNGEAQKKFVLSDEQRRYIDDALRTKLEMAPEDRAALITDLEYTGAWRQFGYGSLIGDPSSETDNRYIGKVHGWQRGAFCKDRHYRGRPEKLAVTMGALPTDEPEAAIGGMILQIDFSTQEDGDEAVRRIVDNIEHISRFVERVASNVRDFARRETSLNPIYAYKVVDVETARNGTVKAIICAADPANPLYLGPDGEQLSIEEKAAIIASSRGVPGASIRNTGMAYWRYVVSCTRDSGLPVEPHIEELVQRAEAYRAALDPELRAELEEIERAADEGYEVPVYDVAELPFTATRAEVDELRRTAQEKLGPDPLTAERILEIKAILEEPAPGGSG